MPIVDKVTFQTTHRKFSSAATRRSDRKTSSRRSRTDIKRRFRFTVFVKMKMSTNDSIRSSICTARKWAFTNGVTIRKSRTISATSSPQADKSITLKNRKVEVELGFDQIEGFKEAQRCLNCDVQTVFNAPKCIECDACVDVCPTACITFTPNEEDEMDLREKLKVPALNLTQDLYVSETLPTRKSNGQRRRRLPPLRSLRRTLSDGGLGYAEVFL